MSTPGFWILVIIAVSCGGLLATTTEGRKWYFGIIGTVFLIVSIQALAFGGPSSSPKTAADDTTNKPVTSGQVKELLKEALATRPKAKVKEEAVKHEVAVEVKKEPFILPSRFPQLPDGKTLDSPEAFYWVDAPLEGPSTARNGYPEGVKAELANSMYEFNFEPDGPVIVLIWDSIHKQHGMYHITPGDGTHFKENVSQFQVQAEFGVKRVVKCHYWFNLK